MSKTPLPAFAQNPKTFSAVLTVAAGSLNTDAPTGLSLLATAGADGALITRLWAVPRATVTITSLLLYISTDGGVTMRLKDSEVMPLQSVTTTAAINETAFNNYSESTPMRLGPNERLYAGIQVAAGGGIVFIGEQSDF